MVEKLLDMARVTPQDYVIDLGSGDGRSVIAAAKRGARAHGIEYDAGLVEVSKREAAKNGVSDKASFAQGDVFASDFSKATVIFLFLTPEMNIRLRPQLLNLKPGTRIVANTFGIGDWNADETSVIPENCERWCTARLWVVPAKVTGTWKMADEHMTLKQTYQTFSGALKAATGPQLPSRDDCAAKIFFSAAARLSSPGASPAILWRESLEQRGQIARSKRHGRLNSVPIIRAW